MRVPRVGDRVRLRDIPSTSYLQREGVTGGSVAHVQKVAFSSKYRLHVQIHTGAETVVIYPDAAAILSPLEQLAEAAE